MYGNRYYTDSPMAARRRALTILAICLGVVLLVLAVGVGVSGEPPSSPDTFRKIDDMRKHLRLFRHSLIQIYHECNQM